MKAHLKSNQEIVLACTGKTDFTTDKRMLKNIMLNLLSNAIKFSPEGKVVKLTTENTGTQLTIVIRDEGLGIPVEDQPFLFSTFFRGKNVNNIQGTGLGLPIIKRYINLLQGDIHFESTEGKGSVFIATLPVLQALDTA